MQIVYANEAVPVTFNKAIFLAGPTPRSKRAASWRPEALRLLEGESYDGVVFVPEYRDGKHKSTYIDQVEWEDECLNLADCVLFWVPRELKKMPALTTNTEWGVWQNSGKAVFGAPPEAVKVRYQQHYAEKLRVPNFSTLEETVQAALKLVGEGVWRAGGEREVPLYIWRTPHFQNWYSAQLRAGNRLDGARVEWTFRVGPNKDRIYLWALHVNVYVRSEQRNKVNEVVIARPDISTIVMYRRGDELDDSDIVLIREFRSPAATDDGFVWEVPGGSSPKPKESPLEVAVAECFEETGLPIEPGRIQQHEARQLAATLSSHKAHLFSVEITAEELEYFRSQYGVAHGAGDSEQTYVEIVKFGDLKRETKVDWSMLGMISTVLTKEEVKNGIKIKT